MIPDQGLKLTKSNILNTATREFAKYGYDGVSMNYLASKLKINKATIYYYFKDKKSLYNEVLKSLINMNQKKVEDLVNKKIDPKERFKEYIALYVKRIKDHPHIISLSLRELASSANNVESTMVKEFERDMGYLADIVSKLDLKKKYENLDFFTVKSLILGTINTYYTIQMSNLDFNGLNDFEKKPDDIFDYLCVFISDILLDALCKD